MELHVLVHVYVCIVLEKLYEFKVCIFVNSFDCNLIIGEQIYCQDLHVDFATQIKFYGTKLEHHCINPR